ncbi:unnamed protein product [Rhizoctonia solani]|uniref:NmrA-like domain-containing protein n=1 Tax=Rhizoctonia solani TaxID=456999 RepID=A0A8H3G969_9AGAM|nr:unnamed protein product [Rhizoctonia solani]
MLLSAIRCVSCFQLIAWFQVDSVPLQEFKSLGASLHVISYDDERTIVEALQGVDILVSTVAWTVLVSAQVPLIKAAKAAGVKLFFPSDYGSLFDNEPNPSPIIRDLKTVLRVMKETGLPYTYVHNGGFPEYCFIPQLGYNFSQKKVTVWGDGNKKSTWTTVYSLADWIVNVLKTFPIDQLQNKHLRIEGFAVTTNKVIKLWEQKHNAKLEVEYRPMEDLDNRLKADEDDFAAALLQEWSSGRGEIGGRDNGMYPEWKPDTIESVL